MRNETQAAQQSSVIWGYALGVCQAGTGRIAMRQPIITAVADVVQNPEIGAEFEFAEARVHCGSFLPQ